jgi:ribosome-associated toxin RatA of RatAB toxin-antitoxin module
MKLDYSNEVLCTKEEAWALITDFERRPEWIPFMEKCYITEKKEGWVGSKYQEKEVFLKIPLNINYTITRWKENEQLSSRCEMPPFYPVVNIFVKDIPGSRKIKCTLQVDIDLGIFKFIPQSIIRPQIDNLINPLVNNFVRILETNSSLK